MSKKSGIVLIIAGMVLILSALSLFLYNRYEDTLAGKEAEHLLRDVQHIIQEKKTPTTSKDCISHEMQSPELPITEIDGQGYVGYLSIPDLKLELPIMAEWDYNKLKIAPCRHFGSSRTDDLVIAAHNYKTHFGQLSHLKAGNVVHFTDMDGIENTYTVTVVDTLAPTEVEAVQNSGHDLVLYTCTYNGATRVSVFCDRSGRP